MDYDSARDYLLSKPEAKQDFPFGADVAHGRQFVDVGRV